MDSSIMRKRGEKRGERGILATKRVRSLPLRHTPVPNSQTGADLPIRQNN